MDTQRSFTNHLPEHCHFDTIAVHAGNRPDHPNGAVVHPLSLSVTYRYGEDLQKPDYIYSRLNNPTREIFERAVAACEKSNYALSFSSGTAAGTVVAQLLKAGDHIAHIDDLYSGYHVFLQNIAPNFGLTSSKFSTIEQLEEVITDKTRLIWIEIMTNPLLKILDIEQVAKIAKKHNCLLLVDCTFVSPYGDGNPLSRGADIVLHSVSKYINGHSDVCMGVLCMNDEALFQRLCFLQINLGATPSPFDCYLATRGLRTLSLRMRTVEKNAISIAHYLESHEQIEKVFYPGLKSHTSHELAKKQLTCFSGMITFYIKGGLKAASAFLDACAIITNAVSLGGVESLVEHPALMTHRVLTPKQRAELGIHDTLIRVSIGVEHVDDLIKDLSTALASAKMACAL